MELRQRIGAHVRICGHLFGSDHYYKKEGEGCDNPAVPGTEYCYSHQPGGPKRVIDRLTEEQRNIAARLFNNGATAKIVGNAIGLTASQAQNLKQHFRWKKEKREVPLNIATKERDLEPVAIMKTEEGWKTLYG